ATYGLLGVVDPMMSSCPLVASVTSAIGSIGRRATFMASHAVPVQEARAGSASIGPQLQSVRRRVDGFNASEDPGSGPAESGSWTQRCPSHRQVVSSAPSCDGGA